MVVFQTYFNPNNSLLIILQMSLLFGFTPALNTVLKGASLLYIFFNKETISATIVNFLVEFTSS